MANDEPNQSSGRSTAEVIAELGRNIGLGDPAVNALRGAIDNPRYARNVQEIQRLTEERLILQATGGMTNEQFSSRYESLSNRIDRLTQSNINIRQGAISNAIGKIRRDIATSYSPSSVNGQTLERMREPEILAEGYNRMSMGAFAVENRIRQHEEIISKTAYGMGRTVMTDLFDPVSGEINQGVFTGLGANRSKIETSIGELARLRTTQRFLKSSGLDIQSQYAMAERESGRAESILASSGIRETYARGGGASLEELQRKEVEISKKLIEVKQKLIDATEENAEALFEERRKLSGQLDETQEAMRYASSAGAGGGRIGRFMRIASAGFGAAGDVLQVGIGQVSAMTQNRGGLAEWENRKYQTYQRAAAGDMSALMALKSFKDAEAYGKRLGEAQGGVAAFNALEGVLGVAAVATGGFGFGPAGIAAGVGAAAHGFSSLFDYFAGTSATARDIQSRNQFQNTVESINRISASQFQNFYGFTTGLTVAGREMGGTAREAMLRSMTSRYGLIRMGQAGITADDMLQYQMMGAQNIGSTFNTENIYFSRNLERAGLGSVQENLGRMAAFAGAGANNPQRSLEVAIGEALGARIENSKVLNAVAQNTAVMAQSGLGMGIDTTAAAAGFITAGIGPGMNQDFAVQQNARLQQTIADRVTDIRPGLTSGVGLARLSVALNKAGVSSAYAPLIQQLDPATLATIRGTLGGEDVNEMRRQLAVAGLSPLAKMIDTPKGLESVRGIMAQATENQLFNIIAGNAGFAFGTSNAPGFSSFMKKLGSGALSASQLAQAMEMQGTSGGIPFATPLDDPEKEVVNLLMRKKAIDPAFRNFTPLQFAGQLEAMSKGQKPSADMQKLLKGIGGPLGKGMEDAMGAQAAQQVASMQVAVDNLGGSAGEATAAIEALANALKRVKEGAPALEKEAADAAARAAGSKGQEGASYIQMSPNEGLGQMLVDLMSKAFGSSNSDKR